jgi:hypothetical protein
MTSRDEVDKPARSTARRQLQLIGKPNIFDRLLTFWRGVPRPEKATTLFLCLAVLAGHVVHRDRQLFPFVRWGMYDTRYEPDAMVAFEMYGITNTGERIHINIGRTLPDIRRGAPMKFTQIAAQAEDRGAAVDARLLAEVVSSVALLHEEVNRTTFTAVEVVKEIIYRDAPGVYRRSSHAVGTVPLRRVTSRSGEGLPLRS